MSLMLVPSEGTLRILRHLALGTSCTLAFTLGVILEDRRRLIHTAQKIRNNAQKLKSSKRYNKSSASAIKAFEERILSDHDRESADNGLPVSPLPKFEKNDTSLPLAAEVSSEHISFPLLSSIQSRPPKCNIQLHNGKLNLGSDKNEFYVSQIHANMERSKRLSNHEKLEQSVASLLEATPPQVERASILFIKDFSENMHTGQKILGITELRRLRLARKLFKECKKESRLNYSQRIFQLVLTWGIKQKVFIPFQMEKVLEKFIARATPRSLEKAVFIYLDIITNMKENISPELVSLGHNLCMETFKHGQRQYNREIFDRMKDCNREFPYKSLGYFLMSVSKDEKYLPEVFEYFVKYYEQIDLSESQSKKIVSILISHLLANRKFNEAERVLQIAAQFAKKFGIFTSEVPCLHLLQNNWETFHDLDRIMALFNRAENYIHCVRRPWLFYEIMIKICIEVEDEKLAWSFYDRSREKYGPRLGTLLAQFTHLKAKKGDWESVENDFKKIDRKDLVNEYSKLFPTILKMFSSNNSIAKTGQFIELAFKIGINFNINTFNKVAEIYAKERDFYAVGRLIQYVTSKGLVLNSVFINMILKQSYTSWKYKIDDVFSLLESILKLDSTGRLVDINTFSYLRSIIISKKRFSECRKNIALGRLQEIFQPYQLGPRDPYNPKHLLGEMTVSLNLKDPKEALEIYNWARLNNVLVGPEHLNVAVEACFRYNSGKIDDAVKLIHASGLKGPQTAASISLLFVHQLQQLVLKEDTRSDDITRLALNFISIFEERGLKIPMQVITQTMSSLERLYYYTAVIDFWKMVSARLGLTTSLLNIYTLTVFLKTCIGMRDIQCFWHILHIMTSKNIIPDHHLRLILHNAKRKIALGIKLGMRSRKQDFQFLETLLQGLAYITQIRSQARTQRKIGRDELIQKIEDNYRAPLFTR